MNKYQLLISVLDSIIAEAQIVSDRNIYNISNEESANQARSRVMIHLFLRTRFGLIDFIEAESFITEGGGDGGLDAYYIDQENKTIYLIQSKFRTSETNFENVPVAGYELFKMDLGAIINGNEHGQDGEAFNGKIQGFQRKIREISEIGRYRYCLVFLGNIPSNLDPVRLNHISGNVCNDVQVINGKETYKQLLLPYLQSDFYNKKEFVLKIKANQSQSNRINYAVNINGQTVNINLSFIPTLEIAKMMNEYKNSLLKFNPRCYVGIKNGGVNQKINNSILQTESNEFSLLNNGITIICNDFQYSDRNAEPGVATLLITNPQIVNGGQTAFTLSKIFSEKGDEIFSNKEVLVKFISLNQEQTPEQNALIEKISEATNNQTPVELSDRKSNDQTLIDLQNYLFENHGLLLERKKGEFYDTLSKNIITKDKIISKDQIMRLSFVINGRVAEARSYANEKLFKDYPLPSIDFGELFKIITIYKYIEAFLQRTGSQDERFRVAEFGYGLKYGKYAIAFVIFNISKNSTDEIDVVVENVKNQWLGFETAMANEVQNSDYFDDGFNYANYYKGKTINKDLIDYFELGEAN